MTEVKEELKTQVVEASVDSWSGLLMEEFLNAKHFEGKETKFRVLDSRIVSEGENAKPKVSLTLEKDGAKYRFDLNITNAKFVRDVDLTPSGLSGKDLTIKKVNVMNPTTQQEVEGLRICKIE